MFLVLNKPSLCRNDVEIDVPSRKYVISMAFKKIAKHSSEILIALHVYFKFRKKI